MPRKGKKGKRGKKGRGKAAPAKAAAGAAKTAKDSQKLPPREERVFKDVMKLYENKAYKKCLKTCDTILKKFPNHGETLSMKGLTLNNLGENEKAHDFCKRGLMANMKSHVTWHVYGLLYRQEKNYAQAVRSYKNALKIAPENMQIMRDVALLQIQTRDTAGFLKSRNQILQKKSNEKKNWLGFAVAQYLNKKYDTALEVLKSYKDTLDKEDREACTYENGELALFESTLIESQGDPNKVIEHLEASKDIIMDKLEWKQRMSRFLIKVGRFDEATQILRALMAENPENYIYHRGLQSCILKNGDYIDGDGLDLPVLHVELTDDQTATFLEMYEVLSLQQPRCNAHKHIPLMFATGDAYKARAHKLLDSSIVKVKDTVFSVLKPIYKREIEAGTSSKLDEGLSYLLECEKSLDSDNTLPGSSDEQTPTSILSTYLFIAQHLDMKGDHERALEYIEKAIAHTPTFIDLYTAKGKILKHAGDLSAAASACDYGRKLDLADRYINCHTTKYLFAAGRIEEAEKIVVLFSKTDGEFQATLFDMQCMWYEIEAAQAYLEAKNYKMALKKFGSSGIHWDTIRESEFDFHGYCLRKSTIRAYLQMLDVGSSLGTHPFYFKGVLGMVRTYLAMHQSPAPKTAEEKAFEGMTKEQQRSYRRKKAKEKAKKDKEAAAAKKKKQARGRAVIDEPDEEKLHNVEDPLAEAWKHVQTLRKRNPDRLETYLAHFDVAMAQDKPIVAMDGLVHACKLASAGVKHPEVMTRALRLFKAAEELTDLDAAVKTEFANERQTLLGTDTLSAVAKAYVEEHASSCSPRSHASLVAACAAAVETDTALTDFAVAALCDAFSSKSATRVTAKSSARAHRFLESIGSSSVEKHRELVLARFPRCLNVGTTSDAEASADADDSAAACKA